MASILLIEDNQQNADYVIRILQGEGHEIDHYTRGLEGGRAARLQRPDLILLDFNLPDIDGSVLVLTLKKNLGGDDTPPIIAVTARNSELDRQIAQKFGFAAFLGKPFEPDELLNVVNTLLENAAQKSSSS